MVWGWEAWPPEGLADQSSGRRKECTHSFLSCLSLLGGGGAGDGYEGGSSSGAAWNYRPQVRSLCAAQCHHGSLGIVPDLPRPGGASTKP